MRRTRAQGRRATRHCALARVRRALAEVPTGLPRHPSPLRDVPELWPSHRSDGGRPREGAQGRPAAVLGSAQPPRGVQAAPRPAHRRRRLRPASGREIEGVGGLRSFRNLYSFFLCRPATRGRALLAGFNWWGGNGFLDGRRRHRDSCRCAAPQPSPPHPLNPLRRRRRPPRLFLDVLGLFLVSLQDFEATNGCRGPGQCERPPDGHGVDLLCSTHRKQLQRTGKCAPIREARNAFERVIDAGSRMLEADADDDAAWRQLSVAFSHACESWMFSRGWRRPGS